MEISRSSTMIRRTNGKFPPLLLGGFIIAILFLAYSYWSLSLQNSDALSQIESLASRLKIEDVKMSQQEKTISTLHEALKENKGLLDAEARRESQLKDDLNSADERMRNKDDEINTLSTTVKELEVKLAEAEDRLSEVYVEKERLSKENFMVISQKEDAESAIASRDEQIIALENDLKTLQQKLERGGGVEANPVLASRSDAANNAGDNNANNAPVNNLNRNSFQGGYPEENSILRQPEPIVEEKGVLAEPLKPNEIPNVDNFNPSRNEHLEAPPEQAALPIQQQDGRRTRREATNPLNIGAVEQSLRAVKRRSLRENAERRSLRANAERFQPAVVDRSLRANAEHFLPEDVDKAFPANVERFLPANLDHAFPANVERFLPAEIEPAGIENAFADFVDPVEAKGPLVAEDRNDAYIVDAAAVNEEAAVPINENVAAPVNDNAAAPVNEDSDIRINAEPGIPVNEAPVNEDAGLSVHEDAAISVNEDAGIPVNEGVVPVNPEDGALSNDYFVRSKDQVKVMVPLEGESNKLDGGFDNDSNNLPAKGLSLKDLGYQEAEADNGSNDDGLPLF